MDLKDENEEDEFRKEVEDYANSKGAYFFLTSAHNSDSIHILFRNLGKIVLNIYSESGIIVRLKNNKKKRKKGGCC